MFLTLKNKQSSGIIPSVRERDGIPNIDAWSLMETRHEAFNVLAIEQIVPGQGSHQPHAVRSFQQHFRISSRALGRGIHLHSSRLWFIFVCVAPVNKEALLLWTNFALICSV